MGRRSCSRWRLVVIVVAAVLAALLGSHHLAAAANLHDDWDVEWGGAQNVKFTQDGNGVALSVASSSSPGCRLRTKETFRYGSISSLIKLVPGDSAGIVTTLYASTKAAATAGEKHEEIDFEFIGNVAGQPYTLHTNLFADDAGGREVEFTPWFDPTADFHNYTISWTSCMLAWYVDGVPIRAYRNYHGVAAYPTSGAMRGYVSIWQTDGPWATHGGRVRTDWSKAPFVSDYRAVGLYVGGGGKASTSTSCLQQQLSPAQAQRIQDVQRKYKGYDYCDDKARFKGRMPPECGLSQY